MNEKGVVVMENGLELKNQNDFSNLLATRQVSSSHAIAVDSAKAVREIESALMVAKARPRDEIDAYRSIMQSSKRISFAEKAIYKYPRGGELIEGPSIRLAEALARAYGNLECGWREIERTGNKSIVEAFAWDLETNTKRKMIFEVAHVRDTKQGQKPLTNERDIYEHMANYAARRLRSCILSIIPTDIIEDAVLACKSTMETGITSNNKLDYAKKIVAAFDEIGVTHEQLRKFLGVEKVVGATEKQLIELRKIYTSIKDGQASIKDFFSEEKPKHQFMASTAEDLIKKLENQQEEKK